MAATVRLVRIIFGLLWLAAVSAAQASIPHSTPRLSFSPSETRVRGFAPPTAIRAPELRLQVAEVRPVESDSLTIGVSGQKVFLSADPKGIDGWVNLYAYGNLNPTIFTDPYGLESQSYLSIIGNFTYTGGVAGNGLRALAGYLDTQYPLSATAGFVGSLANSAAAFATPASYVNNAASYASTVSTLYQQDGASVAASYAATSWNVGAVWSGVANINLATGQPVGNGLERGAVAAGGVAGTAGLAALGAGAVSTPMVTVTHFTDAATVANIQNGTGMLNAGSFVTLPNEVDRNECRSGRNST